MQVEHIASRSFTGRLQMNVIYSDEVDLRNTTLHHWYQNNGWLRRKGITGQRRQKQDSFFSQRIKSHISFPWSMQIISFHILYVLAILVSLVILDQTSFKQCVSPIVCLYGPFNYISFHKVSRQPSASFFFFALPVFFLPYWSFEPYIS